VSQIAGLLLEVYRRLLRAYGPQGWWPAETPFEVMVGAVLTQATAWRNVERAIARLKAADSLSPEAISRLPQVRLEELVRPAGFFRQKARRLKALVDLALSQGGVESLLALPPGELRERLLSVPGIGPETADSILLYAAGYPVFVVDAYTKRILHRLGLLAEEAVPYGEVQRTFQENLPSDPELYGEYHALLVRHAKEHCRTRPRCDGCPLSDLCPRPAG